MLADNYYLFATESLFSYNRIYKKNEIAQFYLCHFTEQLFCFGLDIAPFGVVADVADKTETG